MSKEYTIIDDFDWIEKYKPKEYDGGGLMDVDPRGDNMTIEDFNQATKDRKIWTLIDGDGDCTIINDYHFVNRLEHYYCEVPFKEGELIEVD